MICKKLGFHPNYVASTKEETFDKNFIIRRKATKNTLCNYMIKEYLPSMNIGPENESKDKKSSHSVMAPVC